jgi:hypothetical protein
MIKSEAIEPRQVTPSLIYLVLLYLICIVFSVIYVRHGLFGWFVADDFLFLDKYQDSFLFSEIWTLENFGRFVSRNVYFHLQSYVGNRSEICFLFNLIVLITNSYLVYVFMNNSTRDRFTAVFVGCFYFTMLPSVLNLFWVSNIQQLLSHVVILVFLIRVHGLSADTISAWIYVELGMIYVLGLYTNFAMFCAVPAMWGIFVFTKGSRTFCQRSILFTVCMSVFTILFFVRLKTTMPVHYESEYFAHKLFSNILEYGSGYGVTNRVPKAGYILLSTTFLICFIRSLIRTDQVVILFYALAASTFLPYVFLVHQKSVNYMALPLVFLIAGLVRTIVCAFSPRLVFLFLFLIMMGQIAIDVKPILRDFESPFPTDAQRLISDLNRAVSPKAKTVCLQSSSGIEFYWGLTGSCAAGFWQTLGDGAAFNVFGNIKAAYLPFGKPPCDDRPTILISDDYRIIKIIDPKR